MDIFKQDPNVNISLLNPEPVQSSGISLDSILNGLASRNVGEFAGNLMALSRAPSVNKMGQNLLSRIAEENKIALANKQRAEDLLRQEESTDYSRNIDKRNYDYKVAQDAIANEIAMKEAEQLGVAKPVGELAYLTQEMTSDRYASDPRYKSLIDGRAEYLTKSPEFMYNQRFAGEQGKLQGQLGLAAEVAGEKKAAELQATAQSEKEQIAKAAVKNEGQIDSLIADIEANPEIVGKYSGVKQFGSEWLGVGFNDEELEMRGGINRRISDIQRMLIAEATAAGQSGINIQAEVDRIVKGISPDSDSKILVGALKELKAKQKELSSIISKQTPEIDYSGMSDDDLLKGL